MSDIREVVTGYVDRATFNKEADVKRVVRRILDAHNVFNFMPPANAYGKSGISDILAVGNARVVALECKYGYNKPTAMQLEFGQDIERAGGLFVVPNERNLVEVMLRALTFIELGVDPSEPE